MWLEAVPNISEGRDVSSVRAVARAFTEESGRALLDVHHDPSHHRAVLSAALRVESVVQASLDLAGAAVENIDLRRHAGVHPRIGALDVLPFVPLTGTSRAEAIRASRAAARAIATRFEVPVFLYGASSRSETPVGLPSLRRGGLARLAARMRLGELEPDYGPTEPHVSAGVTVVGVRDFLIAFNVVLEDADLECARRIAREVRASSGGLDAVQAMGVLLSEGEGRAQVSMNLTDYRKTSLERVFREVSRLAIEHGNAIDYSELVGLVPRAAAFDGMEETLRLREPVGIVEARCADAGVALDAT